MSSFIATFIMLKSFSMITMQAMTTQEHPPDLMAKPVATEAAMELATNKVMMMVMEVP